MTGPFAMLVPVAAMMAVAAGSQVGETQRHYYRFARAWAGPGRVVSDAVIAVEGQRIVVVASGASAVPPGAPVVDLRRLTAIPGLIDVHTHMTYYWDRAPGTRPRGQRRRPAVTVYLAQANAMKTLEAGVTSVRDLGASAETDLSMRDLINMGAMVGPRMFVAGQGLSGRPRSPGAAEIKRLVEERIAAGVDWIKLYASTGSFEDVSGDATLSYDEIKAAVDAAHAGGKRIAVHSYGPVAGRDAVRAGADSLEHAVDLDDETLAEMKGRGTVYVPTIDHNRYYVDAREEFAFAPGAEGPLNAFIERNLATAKRAHAAGVRFAMGSDAVYSMFGQNARELEWFVKAGMTPEQALTAGTINGAALLAMPDLGALAPGYLADIAAFEGNPISDIGALRPGAKWVMKGGAVVVERR